MRRCEGGSPVSSLGLGYRGDIPAQAPQDQRPSQKNQVRKQQEVAVAAVQGVRLGQESAGASKECGANGDQKQAQYVESDDAADAEDGDCQKNRARHELLEEIAKGAPTPDHGGGHREEEK